MEDIRLAKLLAERLRVNRKALGIRQEEMAELLDIKRQTYSAYERGVSIPSAVVIKQIANHFGIGVDELFSGPKDNPVQYYEQQILQIIHRASELPEAYMEKLLDDFVRGVDFAVRICRGNPGSDAPNSGE